MNIFSSRWRFGALACSVWAAIGAAAAADVPGSPGELLRNPQFKAAYFSALGPKTKDKWLSTLANSGQVRAEKIAGDTWQVVTPCKPHDCGDNNLLLLWAPAKGVVVGKLFEKGKTTLVGAPSPAMAVELERLWKAEFRRQ